MGFFSSNSESTENKKAVLNWVALTDIGQLNEIVVLSQQKPVLIFKHSTRCSVSRMALRQFENEFDLEDDIIIYFLDLLEFRPISNEIAVKFSVMHQSPQVLLIKKGKVVYDASHSEIDATLLSSKI